MQTETLSYKLASLVIAIRNCEKTGNTEWRAKHVERARQLCKRYLPHGAGLDGSTVFRLDVANDKSLVFKTSFHHMDESGMYDGWTDHTVRVAASFFSPAVTVSGKDRNGVKDDIAERFLLALESEAKE